MGWGVGGAAAAGAHFNLKESFSTALSRLVLKGAGEPNLASPLQSPRGHQIKVTQF